MKFRAIRKTDLKVSEIGFGLWTVSTDRWGKFTDGEAVRLLQKAFDCGITLFDAVDTRGDGKSEELLAKAFPKQRDALVITTKVGYDFDNFANELLLPGEVRQNFSPAFLRFSVEQSLRRLHTDRIDILQLHHLGTGQVADDRVWETLTALQKDGKILHYGAALGPGLGWLYEGVDCIQQRSPTVIEPIYNLLEPYPGDMLLAATYAKLPDPRAAVEELPPFQHGRMENPPQLDTSFFVRAPHCSGLLEGQFTEHTVLPPDDPRPRAWLLNGLKKTQALKFLTGKETGRTLGQAALLWLLAEPLVAACLPNISTEAQLMEFCEATERNRLTREELERAADLQTKNFGVKEELPKYNGTMDWDIGRP